MTCENTTVTRTNFASRLLSKAMSERTKTGEIQKPITAPISEKSGVDTKEPAVSAKS